MKRSYRHKNIASKGRKIKLRRPIFTRLWFWAVVLCAIIVGSALYLLLFYPGIQVKNIVISGNEKVGAKELQDTVSNYSNTSLLNFWSLKIISRSIFLVNGAQISKDVLEKFPEIEKLAIHKHFPQTLNITVTERKPIGVYCPLGQTNKGCFFIDQYGIIFEPVEPAPVGVTIVRQAVQGEQVFSGEQMVSRNIIGAIYTIQKNLKDNFHIDLQEALISSPVRLDITTGERWQIYFDLNTGFDINSQIKKLSLLLNGGISADSRKNLKYIDLRPKDRAIVCDNSICAK